MYTKIVQFSWPLPCVCVFSRLLQKLRHQVKAPAVSLDFFYWVEGGMCVCACVCVWAVQKGREKQRKVGGAYGPPQQVRCWFTQSVKQKALTGAHTHTRSHTPLALWSSAWSKGGEGELHLSRTHTLIRAHTLTQGTNQTALCVAGTKAFRWVEYCYCVLELLHEGVNSLMMSELCSILADLSVIFFHFNCDCC